MYTDSAQLDPAMWPGVGSRAVAGSARTLGAASSAVTVTVAVPERSKRFGSCGMPTGLILPAAVNPTIHVTTRRGAPPP